MRRLYLFLIILKAAWSRNSSYFVAYENKFVKRLSQIFVTQGALMHEHDTRNFTLNRVEKIRKKSGIHTRHFKQYFFKIDSLALDQKQNISWSDHTLTVKHAIKNIKIFPSSRPFLIKYQTLKKDVKWNTLYILSTPYGVLDGESAIKVGTGGRVICIIFF